MQPFPHPLTPSQRQPFPNSSSKDMIRNLELRWEAKTWMWKKYGPLKLYCGEHTFLYKGSIILYLPLVLHMKNKLGCVILVAYKRKVELLAILLATSILVEMIDNNNIVVIIFSHN